MHINCNPNYKEITIKEDGTRIERCECQVRSLVWNEMKEKYPNTDVITALHKESSISPRSLFAEHKKVKKLFGEK